MSNFMKVCLVGVGEMHVKKQLCFAILGMCLKIYGMWKNRNTFRGFKIEQCSLYFEL